ncbi:MAG: class I SAM-dependent methyltransferase [Phormidesmis sp.]
MAVDSSSAFIEELKARAKQADLERLVIPIHGDMAKLDWPTGSLDFRWSEGAAYNLEFEQVLKRWRPLLINSGITVVFFRCYGQRLGRLLGVFVWHSILAIAQSPFL